MLAAQTCGMLLPTLLAGLTLGQDAPNLAIRNVVHDSRHVQPGDCFFALSAAGDRGDEFAMQAERNGAVAIVSDHSLDSSRVCIPVVRVARAREAFGIAVARFFGNPSTRLTVTAITGTNGKTTVAHLCAQALSSIGRPCAYIGTLGRGLLDKLAPTSLTTPDAATLQADFARFVADGVTHVALEASSHGISQHRLAGTSVHTAVFTGLGHDHLDYHQDVECYFRAKRELFYVSDLRAAIINADDKYGMRLLGELPEQIAKFAFTLSAERSELPDAYFIRLVEVNYSAIGSRLTLMIGGDEFTFSTPLVGDFNVQNLMATLGVMLAQGVSPEFAAHSLTLASPVRGRLERFARDARLPTAFVDYAHSPDSLERVLRVVRGLASGRVICVFGCGGERDRTKRPLMGRIASQLADAVIVTSDNPRSEDPSAIAGEIQRGMASGHPARYVESRVEAIRCALDEAAPGDIVLVAGKGHESFQEIRGRRIPQSDQQIINAWLDERT